MSQEEIATIISKHPEGLTSKEISQLATHLTKTTILINLRRLRKREDIKTKKIKTKGKGGYYHEYKYYKN